MNEMDGQLKYGGKEIIDSFNSIANNQGQMEWGAVIFYCKCCVSLIGDGPLVVSVKKFFFGVVFDKRGRSGFRIRLL